ncbi:Neuronal growth regulator 1 [Liparis tanakae]|uniref:Neuronal growth regulator 1 n=1 Tax=Liparis tanakae TaxID=230148 RepID=A0A4Z2J3I0_9TELE|nr:Neuronal growth regulator 1 [Liparis tanakae]
MTLAHFHSVGFSDLSFTAKEQARKHDSGEYLNITGITRDQAGDYECSALNDIASPDTKTVKVTVNFAPSIHEMKSHGVGLGRTALLRCEAAAVPSPTFEWYKDKLDSDKGKGQKCPKQGALAPGQIILALQRVGALQVGAASHIKRHRMAVRNNYTTSVDIVIMTCMPLWIYTYVYLITVISEYQHKPVSWLRGKIIKGQGTDIKNLSSRSVLTVNNMTEDRYGNYTCVASNKLGMPLDSAKAVTLENTSVNGIAQRAVECTPTRPPAHPPTRPPAHPHQLLEEARCTARNAHP